MPLETISVLTNTNWFSCNWCLFERVPIGVNQLTHEVILKPVFRGAGKEHGTSHPVLWNETLSGLSQPRGSNTSCWSLTVDPAAVCVSLNINFNSESCCSVFTWFRMIPALKRSTVRIKDVRFFGEFLIRHQRSSLRLHGNHIHQTLMDEQSCVQKLKTHRTLNSIDKSNEASCVHWLV